MWSATRRTIERRNGEVLRLAEDQRPLSFAGAIDAWRDNEGFRDFFVSELAASAYPAFFWEMPPLDGRVLDQPFECAVIASEALASVRADDSDFAEHLLQAGDSVATFRNIGADAVLVAPKRMSALDCYAHIAAFVREGPREQQHALLQCMAAEAEALLKARRKFWISTSGLGVPWLHVRLDSHPKYYQHRPYAER